MDVLLVRGDGLVLGGGGAGRDGTDRWYIEGKIKDAGDQHEANMRTSYGIGSVGLDLQRSRLYYYRTQTHSDLYSSGTAKINMATEFS